METNLRLTGYIGKPVEKILRDFPERNIRLLFPAVPYKQTNDKSRISVVVVDGLVSKIWLG